MIRITRILLIAAVAVLAALHFSAPASAATFTVTKTADTNDGVCNADCSLREAVVAANANPGADMITVPAGLYSLTIGGIGEEASAMGDLDLAGNVTITGAGAGSTIIDASPMGERVLHVLSGVTATISGVTIQGGTGNPDGGGIYNGGGTLTLNGSIIGFNLAPGVSAEGGGIFNDGNGTVTLNNSIIGTNSADYGGGIQNYGSLIVNSSTVIGNTADDYGGGIQNYGSLTVNSSTVKNNIGSLEAGGILSLSGSVTITNSTISGNSTGDGGGGIHNTGTGTMTVKNSTISGNGAGYGGGIAQWGDSITLDSTTISGNSGGGIWLNVPVTLKNTIVANSVAGGDCSVGVTSAGYNLDSDGTCGLGAIGDLSGTNPLLGPLASNGGPTQTHALLLGSPAINAGSCTDTSSNPVTADQRGVSRPQGPACDKGAFEIEDFDGDGIPDIGDPDDDGDGYWDTDETAKGSNPLNATRTPEHCEGVDNDGDTVIDEPSALSGRATPDPLCAAGADPDGDTITNVADTDDDNDGFLDTRERYMSTDELDDCRTVLGHDAWPPDADANGAANVGDVVQLFGNGKILQAAGQPRYSRRSDADAGGSVNVGDVSQMFGGGVILTSC